MNFYWNNLMGDDGEIQTENVVEAVYDAWNYEANLFIKDTDELIFAPFESNEFNNDLLEQFGLIVIDAGKYRSLQNIKTGEIYKASWEA